MKNFYCMYLPYTEIGQQVADQVEKDIFSTPWGHHMLLIDKFLTEPQKALFYIHQTVVNGWSRNVLHNYIDSSLYERQGKALSNFTRTLPEVGSDLAQEITRDPYNFAFTGITKPYNERILKDALLNNITKFLTELGTGFAYVGKEYRLQIGEKENFIDLLFYNLNLSCYIVLEVKIGSFTFADVGQLGGYVVACNHLLRKEGRDNPTIGLLICKEKDRIQAQYALESSSQPIAISEYDLEKFYPEKLEGTMPTIEEWEAKLGVALNTNNIELFKFRKFCPTRPEGPKAPRSSTPLTGRVGLNLQSLSSYKLREPCCSIKKRFCCSISLRSSSSVGI